MAEGADRDQRTEAPTQKRRADAARKGDVLQSRELGTALVMLGGAAWLVFAGPWFIHECSRLLTIGLSFDNRDVTVFDPATLTTRLVGTTLIPLALLFGVTMLAAVGAPAMLGSLGFRSGAIAFKGDRLNPISGFGRIFGLNGLVELGKALAKAAVLGLLGYWLVSHDMRHIMGLGAQDMREAASTLGHMMVKAVLWLALGLALIAGIDVPVQIIRRNGRLRMTRQEIKEEMRQTEGAPELKQAIRQKQQSLLTGSARKAVTEANVILTNPTHFAVALRYDPKKDFAPMVVARGRGETALAIRSLAAENNVPILEYPQLARAIYFTARAGQTIAEDLYVAVATILAFVFNIDRAMAEGISPPLVEVPSEKHFDENGVRHAT
ncbi:MAG: flagellar biosynthesis protein FlhB [Sphingomonadales bacterium]|mgnify:FL=1|jgi:flagellar biosynthetic protein FlhB|nr:flagellar biosynthesis protein FlhB [Sphingomonadales bacterium]MBP7135443.1 flagellar biosynthesis protein FlhB [Sphingomonadaceae bacterium]MBK6492850.1 flagellar biosynthesis protein FlhB [Sphingomonadales bacterium]MBK6720279.1 flagellar biosynthesis protein FlhB [Sphingomonadales bacterium]MBK8272902.1 flagellar biosynthesis protein FlhB [Sphingomonadales bacterium]